MQRSGIRGGHQVVRHPLPGFHFIPSGLRKMDFRLAAGDDDKRDANPLCFVDKLYTSAAALLNGG